MIIAATFFSIRMSFAKLSSPDAATCNSAASSAVHAKTKELDVQLNESFDPPMPVTSSNE